MPIRFRCAYCNQLMGIARRKAGTVVRCPKCAGQVIVPDPGPGSPEPGKQPNGAGMLFEHSDLDELFSQNPASPAPLATSPPAYAAPRPAAPPPSVELGYDVEPVGTPMLPGAGVFLTPMKLTVISVAMVVLLGLAF